MPGMSGIVALIVDDGGKWSCRPGASTGREFGLAGFATVTFDVSTTSLNQNQWWHIADCLLRVS